MTEEKLEYKVKNESKKSDTTAEGVYIKVDEIDEVGGIGTKRKEKIVNYFKKNKNNDKNLPTYANRTQKNQIFMVGAIEQVALATKKELKRYNQNERLINLLDMIVYGTNQFIGHYTKKMDGKSKESIINTAKTFTLDMVLRKEYKRKYEKNERDAKKQNKIIMNEEQGETLLELCEASCSVCTESGDGCKFKKLLLDLDAEVKNTNPEDGECVFRYKRKGKDEIKNILEGEK
ncbi:MAG: hypothetical protein ACQEQF_00550 [Bacillota bacterium]